MSEQFANAAQTTLAAVAGAADLTITVTSSVGFPTSGTFRVLIDHEILAVTAVVGNVWTVTRAAEAYAGVQAAAAHAPASPVTLVLTKAALAQTIAEVLAGGAFTFTIITAQHSATLGGTVPATVSGHGTVGNSLTIAAASGGATSGAGQGGGNGGALTLQAGGGGASANSATGDNLAGSGGSMTLAAGDGSPALAPTTGGNQAGAGNNLNLRSGRGGHAVNGTTFNQDGDGGNVVLTASLAGGATANNGNIVCLLNGALDPTPNIVGTFTIESAAGSRFRADDTGVGFFGSTAAQQAGNALTNSVTSGGTNDQVANFTDLTTYANSAAAIRNDLYQLARTLKIVVDALRAYGLLA